MTLVHHRVPALYGRVATPHALTVPSHLMPYGRSLSGRCVRRQTGPWGGYVTHPDEKYSWDE